ncbi:hypothetical protein M9458_016953 [Cirrhinus mrigala]|uniref:Peptidase aspartic putative domain-containing protein n=1 Tax=Cirrhinus mrigala TaxID=683832 RepID=A0ABD0QUH1_CIRMR
MKTNILLKTMGHEKPVKTYSLNGNNFIELPKVFTQSSIPVSQEIIPKQDDIRRWAYLNDVQLDSTEAEVDLLIGVNVPEAMEPLKVINSQTDGPYAVQTCLGWLINGTLSSSSNTYGGQSYVTSNRISVARLESLLIDQYNQGFSERMYGEKKELSFEDKQFLSIANDSIKMVKMIRDYKVFMNDIFKKGSFTEEMEDCGIFHTMGSTIRKNERSAFRQETVAVMGDIEGMFHQVKVPKEDKDFLRFLWRPDGNTNYPLSEYRMTVHLFGAVSSLSCANFALKGTADDNEGKADAVDDK